MVRAIDALLQVPEFKSVWHNTKVCLQKVKLVVWVGCVHVLAGYSVSHSPLAKMAATPALVAPKFQPWLHPAHSPSGAACSHLSHSSVWEKGYCSPPPDVLNRVLKQHPNPT